MMKSPIESGPQKPEGDAAEFIRLKNEYEYNPSAKWSKFKPDFFLKIASHLFALEPKGLPVFNDPKVQARVANFKSLADEIGHRGTSPVITDEEVHEADKFLNYIIAKMKIAS